MTNSPLAAAAAAAPSIRRDDRMPALRAQHDRLANAIRALAMDAVEQAKSGHPGLPMGAALPRPLPLAETGEAASQYAGQDARGMGRRKL